MICVVSYSRPRKHKNSQPLRLKPLLFRLRVFLRTTPSPFTQSYPPTNPSNHPPFHRSKMAGRTSPSEHTSFMTGWGMGCDPCILILIFPLDKIKNFSCKILSRFQVTITLSSSCKRLLQNPARSGRVTFCS